MRMTIGMPRMFTFLPPSSGARIGFIGKDGQRRCSGWQVTILRAPRFPSELSLTQRLSRRAGGEHTSDGGSRPFAAAARWFAALVQTVGDPVQAGDARALDFANALER